MEELLTSLSTYGYIILFFYSLGGGFFALIGASVLAYMGKLDIMYVLVIAYIANFLGDMMLLYLARHNKKDLKDYLKKHRRKLALSHLLMKKYGSKIIIFQKFLYGLKTLIPMAIGLTRYDTSKFMFWNAIATAVFVLSVGLTSFYSADALLAFASYVKDNPIIAPVLLLSLGGLVWFYFHKVTKKA